MQKPDPQTTRSLAEMRQLPDVDEGARAWAMMVPHDGSGLTGERLRLWQWGWRDAEQGYRSQFKSGVCS